MTPHPPIANPGASRVWFTHFFLGSDPWCEVLNITSGRVNMSAKSSRSPCTPWSCCAITVWVMTRWGLFTRPLFSVSCCTPLRRGGDSPAQPTNNVWRHQYDELYVPACTRPTIFRFLNWSKTWTTTYLQAFGTIRIMFCTNFYLIKSIINTIFDHVSTFSLTVKTDCKKTKNYISLSNRMLYKDIY